jgi:hypothetical protein
MAEKMNILGKAVFGGLSFEKVAQRPVARPSEFEAREEGVFFEIAQRLYLVGIALDRP